MDSRLQGQVTLTFIRGGIAKSGRPYLQCSNGRSEFFLNIPKNTDVSTFEQDVSAYNEDDQITLEVSVLVGTDSVAFQGFVE